MGFTRFCHGSRIVGKEPAALFALATADAERLAWVVARRMREAPDTPEREILSEELWLPSSPSVARAGVVTRVANYLCFAHDKVRLLRARARGGPPVWRCCHRAAALPVVPRLRAPALPVPALLASAWQPACTARMSTPLTWSPPPIPPCGLSCCAARTPNAALRRPLRRCSGAQSTGSRPCAASTRLPWSRCPPTRPTCCSAWRR